MGIITEFKEIQINRNVITKCECDNCWKAVNITDDEIPDDWYYFSAWHSEWGNDSWDGDESYLSCSFDCYLKNLHKAFIEFEEYKSAIIDNKRIDFLKNTFTNNK
jgi:hypothetical protein